MTTAPHPAHGELQPRPSVFASWERTRSRRSVHWIVECLAEALGTFIYVYAGTGSTAGYVVGNILQLPGVSSLLQIGLAYGLGIVLALVVAQPTSNGQFNPAFTLLAALEGTMSWPKAGRYVIAQIVGAYIACLLVYTQYKNVIEIAEGALRAAGKYDEMMFTPSGPGGILALYAPEGAKLGQVFLNEFVSDFILALCILMSINPTNYFSSPVAMPFLIGMSYTFNIWGFAPVGLCANAARDLGGRLAGVTIYGRAAGGGPYAALAALTNIPATLLAAAFFELVLRDGERTVTPEWLAFLGGKRAEAARKNGEELVQRSGGSSTEKVGAA